MGGRRCFALRQYARFTLGTRGRKRGVRTARATGLSRLARPRFFISDRPPRNPLAGVDHRLVAVVPDDLADRPTDAELASRSRD
jgi:hypothetical protein